MPKLLWVALPLLLAAALLAWAIARRRAPSRRTLNIASSLLLVVYVGTTAALGIFWVASQQLPVFDWHYLFGYATLALLALHLYFNLPAVWRHFTRVTPAHPAAPAADRAARPRARRRWLGAAGATLATAAAYVLGVRQGRDERPRVASAPAAADTATDGAATGLARVERFHADSAHARAGLLRQAPSVAAGAAPPRHKSYPGAPRLTLPAPDAAATMPFGLAALSKALWHTAGITAARAGLELRASPSSGALFPTEWYVVARAVAGLAPGLWHYDAAGHRLQRLGDAVADDAALGAADEPLLRGAAAVIVASAVFRRSAFKYRDRTYRYVLADLGHALENLRVAARAVGAGTAFVMRFDESRAVATLGLDQAEEGVLALLALHPAPSTAALAVPVVTAAAAPAATVPGADVAAAAAVPAADSAAPTVRAPAPVPPAAPAATDITAIIHAATSWRTPGVAPATGPAPAPQHTHTTAPATGAAAAAIALPAASASTADVLGRIAVRRSIRRYTGQALPLDALSAVLMAMRAPDASAWSLSQALQIDVVVHAVDALTPGAYRYLPAAHALQPRRADIDLRRAARAAALDQDVVGDAAAVFVLAIDRAALLADAAGPARGYRHAFVHAGCLGERIYLEAVARGLGACTVGAFYDDEAAELVAADPAREWVVQFTALGVPA